MRTFVLSANIFNMGPFIFLSGGGGGRGVLKKNMALKRGVKRKIVGIKAEGLPNKFL